MFGLISKVKERLLHHRAIPFFSVPLRVIMLRWSARSSFESLRTNELFSEQPFGGAQDKFREAISEWEIASSLTLIAMTYHSHSYTNSAYRQHEL